MRVLMTGGGTSGHVNPALAIAETIKLNIKGSKIAFVGTPHGIENKLVPRAGYKLYHVDVKGFSRSLSPSNIKAAYLAAVSPHRAKKIIREFLPDVVIGTGGYVCWPILKAASDMKIHTILHESNAYPGVAVKMLSGRAEKILLNFAETEKYLKCPKDKLVVVGNPLRSGFAPAGDKKAAKRRAGIDPDKYDKMILSYGGSMGAQRVNEAVLAMMRDFTSKHPEILHILAVGAIEYKDATEMFRAYGLDKFDNLMLLEYIYDMPEKMAAADLIICRAGAMTMSEVAAMRKPAIFIPSPNVTENHQYKNAKVFEDAGAGIIIEERELADGEPLTSRAAELLSDGARLDAMGNAAGKFAVADSNRRILSEIKRTVLG